MDRPSGDGEASVCEFRSSQSKGLKAKSLSVTVHYSNSDVRGSAPEITSNLNAAGFTNVRQVSGVGDSAVWATRTMMGKPMGELTVLKGKSVMLTIISNGVPDEASALERSKALAAKLLPKT